MTYKDFRKALEVLGETDEKEFCARHNIATRQTLYNWAQSGEISRLAEYVVNDLLRKKEESENACTLSQNNTVRGHYFGAYDLFKHDEMNIYEVMTDFLKPEFGIGDVVFALKANLEERLLDGYWLVSYHDTETLCIIVTMPDGSYRLSKKHNDDTPIIFGREHYDKVKPIGRVVYQLKRRG